MTTGQRIKAARKKAGITQKELGAKLGLSFQAIAQWENDLRNPKMETLEKIADALHISVYVLTSDEVRDAYFSGYNSAIQTKRFRDAKNSDEAEDAEEDVLSLLLYFDELDEYGQKRAVACTRAISGRPHIIGQDAKAEEKVIAALVSLNEEGQQKAVERVEELTEIPKYQRTDNPPEPTQEPPEDK